MNHSDNRGKVGQFGSLFTQVPCPGCGHTLPFLDTPGSESEVGNWLSHAPVEFARSQQGPQWPQARFSRHWRKSCPRPCLLDLGVVPEKPEKCGFDLTLMDTLILPIYDQFSNGENDDQAWDLGQPYLQTHPFTRYSFQMALDFPAFLKGPTFRVWDFGNNRWLRRQDAAFVRK